MASFPLFIIIVSPWHTGTVYVSVTQIFVLYWQLSVCFSDINVCVILATFCVFQ